MTVYNLVYKYTDNGDGTSNVRVSIQCIDTATEGLTNGNNVIVYYTQSISGVGQYLNVTIPGQSVLIYSGSYNSSDSWVITGNSGTSNPSPPVSRCDIVISSINVNQPESSIDANDASITVVASSSYLPIQYSLDNITFQTSPTFSGLSGGLKTVYAKDANEIGCLVNSSVTIPIIANLLTDNPAITLAGGQISRWNAAFNDIVFKFQRKDYEVESIALNTSDNNAALNINGDMTNLVVGANIYLNTPNYIGNFTVVSILGSTVVINVPFTVDSEGYVNIDTLRPYYKIYINISYNDPVTGMPVISSSKYSSNGTGLVKANIKSFCQSLLQANDQSLYNLVNYRDPDLSASYRLSYAQHWEDGSDTGYTSDYIDLTDTYYTTFTARQLGDKYGGNMADFVPFKTLPAKWITDFFEPVYSAGYPFDLSFIYSEDMAGLQLYYKITLLDINRNVIGDGTNVTAYLLNENGTFLLNQDGSKLIIAQQSFYNIPIAEHIGLNRLLIDNDFDPDVYYFKVGIFYLGGTPATINYVLTEEAEPNYTDSNLQVITNEGAIIDVGINGSGSVNTPVNIAASIRAFSQYASSGPNPLLTLIVKKNGTTVFAQSIVDTAGAEITYNITTDVSAVYDIEVTGVGNGTSVTPVNIPDTNSPGQEMQVLSDQVVRVDKNCDYNSVYIRWIGLTGSWNYYRFIFNQLVTLDVQNSSLVTRYVDDWENDQTIEDVITKSASEKITVYAEEMTIDEIKGCQSMKYSPKVQLLTKQNPLKWQTIVVNTASFAERETQLSAYLFQITFNKPSLNIQTQ